MPGPGLSGSDSVPGHPGKMQDVRSLQEGLSGRGHYLGEEDAGRHRFGEMHPVPVLHPGVQVLGDRIKTME